MNSYQVQMDDFLNGMRDCKEGVRHEAGKSQDYDRGYRVQYELEQMKAWETENAR